MVFCSGACTGFRAFTDKSKSSDGGSRSVLLTCLIHMCFLVHQYTALADVFTKYELWHNFLITVLGIHIPLAGLRIDMDCSTER